MALIAVCSNKPRPSVQKGAKGHQWWARDVYHLQGEGKRTLCGVDASDWLTVGEMQELTPDCCTRCAKAMTAPIGQVLPQGREKDTNDE